MALARQVGGGAVLVDASPIRHDTYFGLITTLVMLFCAAQAPEILGRDQRHGLLSLYFSRALRRVDYAMGRLAGIVVAILVFVLVPQSIIVVGSILSAVDTGKQLAAEISLLPTILGQAAIISLLLGSIATVISAFTPRRVYATTSIIAVLFVSSLITTVLAERGSVAVARLLVLLSPNDVLDATNSFLFGRTGDDTATALAQLPGPVYLAAAAAITTACIALLVRRYERIAA
jgi:ABC-2 type transport system permease protein